MNKLKFQKLIRTLVKEEMNNQKELMEIGDLPFSMSGSGGFEDDFSYHPDEDIEHSKPKMGNKERIKSAIDVIASFFGKPKSKVTKDEVMQYLNKK